jgi:hypothetical protein
MLVESKYELDTVPVVCTALTSMASSSTLIAGASSLLIDNRTNKDLNHGHRGRIKPGAGANTANTKIEIWCVIPLKVSASGVTILWPDVFTGADIARTLTNLGVKSSSIQLLDSIDVIDTATPANGYTYSGDIKSLYGYMPDLYQLFFTQNTGQALSSTGADHVMEYSRQKVETV